jgi:hypothetical protein
LLRTRQELEWQITRPIVASWFANFLEKQLDMSDERHSTWVNWAWGVAAFVVAAAAVIWLLK